MLAKQRAVRTWIELDSRALISNFKTLSKLVPTKTKFLAVIKSNAYGHGLTQTAKLLVNGQQSLVNSQPIWFGVDSIVEGLRLRREGINNPILVLGMTLAERIREATQEKITLTVSSLPILNEIAKEKVRPVFHLKIDTGMHRQGFFPSELPKVIKVLKLYKLVPEGIYTHFASAKDSFYPAYTREQLRKFKKAIAVMHAAGYKNFLSHSAASGGTLLFPESHLDMVRVGMALYGYYPSLEAGLRTGGKVKLRPVLSWKSIVGEVKEIPAGSFVGYDLTEKMSRKTKLAVIPVGYWHGFDRGLSSVGEVLIHGLKRKVLGRVSMDMIIADVTDGKRKVQAGDTVTIIGRDQESEIWADEMALKLGTSPYEVLTRINPLIHKEII